MLKSKQHYTATFSSSPHQLVLGALFFTLTDGVEVMRDRLLGVVDSLPAGHPRVEETLQLLVRTIFVYNSRHSSPASLLREVLERAITLCPNNTIFLSLYLWGEASRRVYGNVQRLTSRLVTEDHGIVPLLWAVWAEAQGAARTFYDAGGSGAERVRRALNLSINSAKGRQSAGLWLLYIEFEILMGRPETAKALCYRAIAAVGGCKGKCGSHVSQKSHVDNRPLLAALLNPPLTVYVPRAACDHGAHDRARDPHSRRHAGLLGRRGHGRGGGRQ